MTRKEYKKLSSNILHNVVLLQKNEFMIPVIFQHNAADISQKHNIIALLALLTLSCGIILVEVPLQLAILVVTILIHRQLKCHLSIEWARPLDHQHHHPRSATLVAPLQQHCIPVQQLLPTIHTGAQCQKQES